MDGGGRLLRSLSALASDLVPPAHAPLRLAVAGGSLAEVAPMRPVLPVLPARQPARRRPRRRFGFRLAAFVAARPRLVGYALAGALFVAAGFGGTVYGGQYAAFVEANGSLPDLLARTLGMGIAAVTISGMSELSEKEVLAVAGIDPKRSLVFLDAAEVRRKLKADPIVQDASVTKLYPDRLLISLTEREPFALWQKDGDVSVIGRDGTAIDRRRDGRHDGLPFIAGDNANLHAAEYVKILAAAGDLKPKIRAGTLIAERRWNLVMTSGVLVKLPETDPDRAVAMLAGLERNDHILDKDIVFLDLRIPGRVVVRLTDEAAAVRADALARKAGKRGGPT